MPDQTFEAKFAQIANNLINDRVPALLPYRVGFQLIDKNDDETRAIGVAGFVLNNLFLYMPVFFLNGALKGLDLLYCASADAFVPAQDNWINLLKQEGTSVMGWIPTHIWGQDRFYRPEQANLAKYPFQYPSKLAGDNSLLSHDAFCRMSQKRDKVALPTFPETVGMLGKEAKAAVLNTMLKNPEFANALFTFYTPAEIHKMAAEAVKDIYALPGEPKKDEVLFVTSNADAPAGMMADAEKKLLMRNGVFVIDKRLNFSQVFQTAVDANTLQNPAEPGIYDVMLSDGSFETFIVLLPQLRGSPNDNLPVDDNRVCADSASHTDRSAILIRPLDKSQEYIPMKSREVFCKRAAPMTERMLSGLRGGERCTRENLAKVIADERREMDKDRGAPVTNWVNRDLLIVQSARNCLTGCLELRPNDEAPRFRMRTKRPQTHRDWESTSYDIEFIREEGHLGTSGKTLLIPEGCRMFRRSREDVRLGDLSTIERRMLADGLRTVKVQANGTTANVVFGKQASGLIDKTAALQILCLRHGIFGGQAIQMLKEANREPNHTKTFFIKHAAPYDLDAYVGDFGQIAKTPWMGGPAPVVENATREQVRTQRGNPMMSPMDASGNPILPQQVIQSAIEMANGGVKEVFDVGMMSNLVETADLSELKQDYINRMIKGMDAVGRMLFLFYWHQEQFEERYGQAEMRKLESTLRQVFKTSGDLVIFLREKNQNAPLLSDTLEGTLAEDVGAGLAPTHG
jgi:hypothetical protein